MRLSIHRQRRGLRLHRCLSSRSRLGGRSSLGGGGGAASGECGGVSSLLGAQRRTFNRGGGLRRGGSGGGRSEGVPHIPLDIRKRHQAIRAGVEENGGPSSSHGGSALLGSAASGASAHGLDEVVVGKTPYALPCLGRDLARIVGRGVKVGDDSAVCGAQREVVCGVRRLRVWQTDLATQVSATRREGEDQIVLVAWTHIAKLHQVGHAGHAGHARLRG